MGSDQGARARTRIWIAAGLAAAVFLVAWGATVGETLTYDEAVYADIAEHPFHSDYYPGDVFLRHPPLGLGLLSVWDAADLPLRGFPLLWGLAGIALLASAIRARDGSPWLMGPVVLSPVIMPLTSVTMYPPLFAALSLAAWGWAHRHRTAELVGWNLAVFTHELALLALAFVLLPRAVAMLRRRVSEPRAWIATAAPYPAALAWGAVMLAGVVGGTDPRGGILELALNPTPNVQAIIEIKPLISLVVLLTLVPLLGWTSEKARHQLGEIAPMGTLSGDADKGLAVAAGVAILAAPFYRYLIVLVPLLVVVRAAQPTSRTRGARGAAIVLGASLAASGAAAGMMVQGVDTLNAASVPGLVDHEAAADLLEPGETTVVRSPPSFAHVLTDDGWKVTALGPEGPKMVVLERGGDRIVLQRAEAPGAMTSVEGVDAVLVPAAWDGTVEDLVTAGWQVDDRAGELVRLEPTTAARGEAA